MKVNKVVYILLALFLGGVGAHLFYAKKIGPAVAYLLLCWTGIPSILALVQLITAIMKPADEKGEIDVTSFF